MDKQINEYFKDWVLSIILTTKYLKGIFTRCKQKPWKSDMHTTSASINTLGHESLDKIRQVKPMSIQRPNLYYTNSKQYMDKIQIFIESLQYIQGKLQLIAFRTIRQMKGIQLKDLSRNKRKQLTSQDLKRRLYQKGIHGSSMPSLKKPMTADKSSILYVNLNSSFNKRESNNSPKILKKTASAFNQTGYQRGCFPKITATELSSKRKPIIKVQQSSSPTAKTSINFYRHKRTNSQPKEQVAFNSSFYKNESLSRQNQTQMTKRLVQRMAGRNSQDQNEQRDSKSGDSENSKDAVMEKQEEQKEQVGSTRQKQQSSLQEYIKLVIKKAANIDQFLYLVRRSKHLSLDLKASSQVQGNQQPQLQQDNIYQLQIIDYQRIKSKDKELNFEYYTVSKKGFCHYYNGKPIEFIDLHEWLEEKEIYEKIKKLNFFSRFRRWKTIKMWIKKVVRHRIEKCCMSLEEKLFILNPTVRHCILEIKHISLEMEKSLSIISRNQGSYSLESFKHCQQKTRRQAAGIVQQFSRRSRQSVRKCFQSNLQNLKDVLKSKNYTQDKNFAATSHNPKDNAFQVLGFPAKMSYQNRSKLRKLTGRFVRFSYLVDILHLNGLAGIFKSQIQSFSQKLNNLQIQSEVMVNLSTQVSKTLEQTDKQKMFNIQLIFKPTQIAQYSFEYIPMETFDISMKIQRAVQIFNPLYHIRQKEVMPTPGPNRRSFMKQQPRLMVRKYIPNICDLWLSLKPTLDNIFDELSFLIKQSMSSLKYFQRWSKHRQMQKYINILQEWDDIVSQNWQILQNDNLDPISIIDNLQSSMSKIKEMIQVSESKLTEKMYENTTQPLNVYWENTQANVDQLLSNQNIENSAETIQFYLSYMTQQIQRFELNIPNSIELGIFSISLDKMRRQIIDFMRESMENLKQKLPSYVEELTNSLNDWFNDKSQRLREEIHNIDDFVKLNKSLKLIQAEFYFKKDLCNDLGHIYQTMYNFNIQTKKRKEFEVQTLKAKDQLQQLISSVEQNIERKTQFFTRQVSRYHLPNLLRDIQKISDNISSQEFQSVKSSCQTVIKKLFQIKEQYNQLKDKKQKCLEYLAVLKLSEVGVQELDQLQKQIQARLQMWESMQTFNHYILKINSQIVCQMDLETTREVVNDIRHKIRHIELIHNKPNNDVLQKLKEKVEKYFVNIPLLQGFNERLSEDHWDEINEIVKDYPVLDLMKKEFTLKTFLQSQIGRQSKKINFIFSKAKVQNQLQQLYSQVQNTWQNTLVKSKVQSKFIIISNPQMMRQSFDYMIRTLSGILANSFSQTLRQYSVTYDSLLGYYNTFENWMLMQGKLLRVDSQCKFFDVKKLPDYSQFQNCQKIYKNIMKLFSNRNVEIGVKMARLFVHGLDEKLQQIDEGLRKVQDNIKTVVQEHRRNYPPFYLFSDQKLFKIITQPNNPTVISRTAKQLIPCIQRIQFEGERISQIYNFDQEKVNKSTISVMLDIEQILLQIADTITDINRKNMRSCRYKAVQTNLVKLLPLYQTQYLLAINKVDFSNYTQISIDNQSQISDSLKEFYKVMKKDITEDLRIRNSIKQEHLVRYDTLILQSLYHEQLLCDLIKKNLERTSDFEWQRQLRFGWDQFTNQETNITVKHCHSKLKYGNQYVGSRSKVVVNSDLNLVTSLAFAQKAVYLGSQYNLQKIMAFFGHRLVTFNCQSYATSKDVTNFLVGNWYLELVCFYNNFDYLQERIKQEIVSGNQIQTIKDSFLKKNLFNPKQNEKKQSAIFLGLSHQNKRHDFRGKCRVINYVEISINHLKNIMKIKGIFQNDVTDLLLKLFQMVNYLQERTPSFNISPEDFLDNHIQFRQNITKQSIFQQFLKYIKPRIGFDNISIIQESVKLHLSLQTCNEGVKDQIVDVSSHTRTMQKLKQKRDSKRSSQRISQQGKLFTKQQSKAKPQIKLKKPAVLPQIDQNKQKCKQIKSALTQRSIVILTGLGNSKIHCVKQLYRTTHKINEIFSGLSNENFSSRGIVRHYIQSESQFNVLFYLDGLNSQILRELQLIWTSQGYKQIKSKMKSNNYLVVVGVQNLNNFDFSSLSPFYIVNVQLTHEYLEQVGKQWAQTWLQSDKDKQGFMKFFSDTLLVTFDNWSIKDVKIKERNIYIFLTYLKSLLPVAKLLQAMTYCFIRVFPNLDADYIKLQFLVKKLIGEDNLSQQYKVYDLVYSASPNSHNQSLMYSHKYFQSHEQLNDNKKTYFDYVITPQLFHYETIMRRILQNTVSNIWLIGPQKSGKSSLYQIYKHNNYSNKSFLRITMNDHNSNQRFRQRVLNNLSIFSLDRIKSKINYEKSIIMIDDVNLEHQSTEDNQAGERNKLIHEKLALVRQLAKYNLIEYPSDYQRKTYSKNLFQKKMYNLSDVKFILSGKQPLQGLKQCTVPIQLQEQQHQVKSIFSKYLRQRLTFSEVNNLSVNDIASTTYDICKKLSQKSPQLYGFQLVRTKDILSKLSQLKIKDSTSIIKQVQKYWVYLLIQQLGKHDHKQAKQSLIFKQLRNLNLQDIKAQTLNYSYLHIKDGGYSKKLQYVKDIKKIFNSINQKIEKYNQSQNKRYGSSFDYIHFDQLIKKVIKLSNNLPGKDHLLYGRKGTGKETIIKMVAYLQGSNYKLTESNLKSSIMDIFLSTNITTMSSYVIAKKISSLADIQQLKQFYYTDFQNQILGSKQLQKPVKIPVKDRQKQKQQRNLITTTKSGLSKTYANMLSSPEFYIAPRTRLSQQDSIRYRDAIRIVLITDFTQVIGPIPTDIKQQLIIDEMQEIPIGSTQQYVIKFLDAQKLNYTVRIPQLMAQIYDLEKERLHLSLKSNDDAIRLFSSFMVTLKPQIKEQLNKYGKVLQLYEQIKKIHQLQSLQVDELHGRIKSLNELIMIEDTEERKQQKAQVQTQLHRVSSCLSKSQKVLQMLSMLIHFFKDKHCFIHKYILDVDYFEESLVLAACYFTFLSQMPMVERRAVLSGWYKNEKVPALMNSQPIQNFLTLFNLYPEEFNAQPIDDLEDFYQNMAIVFNSVKPVIIKDKSRRCRGWLETVCSFLVVSQKQSNFIQVICENLTKPSNILIEITNQQTLNTISDSFINTLLFLGENTETINIKGKQIKVSPQAKFYVLLGEGMVVSREINSEFTNVTFSESQALLQKSLQYGYVGMCHPQSFYSQLDFKRKIRNLRLEQQALMLQIAQTICTPFQNKANKQGQEQPKQNEQGEVQFLVRQTKQYYEGCIDQITDKTMTRGQNLTNKLKQKQELCKDLQLKHDNNTKYTQQTREFVEQAKQLLSILQLMSQKSQALHQQYIYPKISHQQFVKKINLGLKRGFIFTSDILSLYLFAVKMWGAQYVQKDFYVFLLLVLSTVEKVSLEISKDKVILQEPQVKKQKAFHYALESSVFRGCQSLQKFKLSIRQNLSNFLSQFTYQQLIPYLQFSGTINNLQEGQDRKIVLNCIWMNDHEASSKCLQIKLQQTLKTVTLQIKDTANLQNQIKKYVFQENVLVMSSLQVLQVTLNYLRRLGTHEKTLYFKCPLVQSQLNKVQILAKRYNVSQINNVYSNSNNMLNQCLLGVQKQRQLRKMSSVTNIKSLKNIGMVKVQSTQSIRHMPQSKPQESRSRQLLQTNNQRHLGKKSQKTIYLQNQAIKNISQQSMSNNKILLVLQSLQTYLKQVYSDLNLQGPYSNKSQLRELVRYVNNCILSNDDQQDSIQQKISLILKCLQHASREGSQVVDAQVTKKMSHVAQIFTQILSQHQNAATDQQLDVFLNQLEQLATNNQGGQDTINQVSKRANKVKFQNQFLSYFKRLLSIQEFESQMARLIKKARKIYDSLRIINEPILIKRNSRKSINAFFRKQEIKERLFTSPSISSSTSAGKKPGIKRLSRQALLVSKGKQPLPHSKSGFNNLQAYLTQLLVQIEYKKLQGKITCLTSKIQNAINKLSKYPAEEQGRCIQLQLILILLQDKIPGTWLIILQTMAFTRSLTELFKKYIRLQQDISYNLQKIKRSNHSQIDFSFIKYPLEYIQFHFRKKITHTDPTVYIIGSNPTPQELQFCEDYLKIASIQASGWKFNNQPNTIDILTSGQRPLISEGRLSTPCCFMKKQFVQTMNLTPIDVFESKASPKPIMKVYANSKKNVVLNSATNNLYLFLNQENPN